MVCLLFMYHVNGALLLWDKMAEVSAESCCFIADQLCCVELGIAGITALSL